MEFDQMHAEDERSIVEVKCALGPGLRVLLRHAGTEDGVSIVWATFSDDEGVTRIVMRAYREQAIQEFSLLAEADLRDGLSAARSAGTRKVYWGAVDSHGVDCEA
jgi:hypothetical protein